MSLLMTAVANRLMERATELVCIALLICGRAQAAEFSVDHETSS